MSINTPKQSPATTTKRNATSASTTPARIILVAHDDHRLVVDSSAACRFEQDEQYIDGPAFLAIRENATDCTLAWAAARFSIAMGDLVKFRDSLTIGRAS